MTTLQDLPNELLLRLAVHLPVLECFRIAKGCRRFCQVLISYRALGCRLYAEAFPPTQTENELLRWLLITVSDNVSPLPLSPSPHSMLDITELATTQINEQETHPLYQSKEHSHEKVQSTPVEYMEWNMDSKPDWISEALPPGIMRDNVDWWDLLQRRGRVELRWRTLSPEKLPLPPLPNLAGKGEEVSVLCARPWGTLLAVNEEQNRLFWLPRSAPSTTKQAEMVAASNLNDNQHQDEEVEVEEEDIQKKQKKEFVVDSPWTESKSFNTTTTTAAAALYQQTSCHSTPTISPKLNDVHFPFLYEAIESTHHDDDDINTINDDRLAIVPDIDESNEFTTVPIIDTDEDCSINHNVDTGVDIDHDHTSNKTTPKSLFYTSSDIETDPRLLSTSESTRINNTPMELDLGGAQLNLHRCCEVSEQYIVHVSWIPVVMRASVHIWRVGHPRLWLVLATASQCWIIGLRGDWLILRQREPNEDGDRICMVNLRTRVHHSPVLMPVDASQHLHHVVRDAATLFVCCTTTSTAEPSDHSSGGIIAEWHLWQAPRSSYRRSTKMIDLRNLAPSSSLAEDLAGNLYHGTSALTRIRGGHFVLNGIWPNFNSPRITLFVQSTRIDDAHVLLRFGPGIGHDDTHIGIFSLKDTGKLLWLKNTDCSGVELMPGQDLLLTWAYETGIHQLYQLSTGVHLQSYFGRRWYPMNTIIGSICMATVPSDVQLIYALMDVAKDVSNNSGNNHCHQTFAHTSGISGNSSNSSGDDSNNNSASNASNSSNGIIANNNNDNCSHCSDGSCSSSITTNTNNATVSHAHHIDSIQKENNIMPLPILLNSDGYSYPIARSILGQLGKRGQLVEAICPTYCCVKDQDGRWLLDFAASDAMA
ncbi:hypothetical protein BDF19DRAFT_421321 [Syncephalis fuscata]|nr:hypothetical protein BDF19DRAFT_421321 [Syncephalis fuscata]